jgi:tetratricopeptide (TPR) repeat protein
VYRLGKFVRRNKTLVGGVVTSLALRVAGAGAVTWQLMQTREEAAKATAINQFLTKLLALANPEEGQDGLVAQQWSGRVPTVVELIDEASRELETAFPEWPDVRGELYFRLGKTYWGLGRNDEMRSHFARAYELRAEALGEDDPETLVTLVWWAFALEFERPLDALRMHERAAEGLTRLLGPGDPRTLFAHISLGDNLAVLGRLQESERVFRETIDLARRHLGPQHRTTLMAVSTAGLHLVGAGKPHEAERLVREPLEISRHSLPEADPTTADLARVLGNALKDQGRPAEALEFLQEAYAWEHRDSPGVSRSALRATFTLARAFRDLGRPSEAEPLYRKKLEDCRRELGDHEFTVWALFVLGDFLRTQGRLDDAETLLGTALDHYGQALGEDEFHVLWAKRTLALVFRDQGRLEEAERLLKNAVDGLHRISKYRYVTIAMGDLADLLMRRDKLDEAESIWRQRLSLQQGEYGNDHPTTLRTMNQLAWVLKDHDERLADAEELAREATNLARSAFGEDNDLSISIADTLAVVLHLRGRNEDAIVEFEAVAAAARKTAGDRWFTRFSSAHYARSLVALGRYEEAETVLLAIHDSGDKSGSQALVALYEAWGRPEKAAECRVLLREAEASTPD